MTDENRSLDVTILTFAVGLIAALLTVFFLYLGTVKLFGWPNAALLENQTTRFFDVYGVTRPMVIMIGLTELFGAFTVSFHRHHWIGLAGAAALLIVSTGALNFHLQYDRAGMVAFRAMILSAFVLVAGGGLYLKRVGMLRIETLPVRRADPENKPDNGLLGVCSSQPTSSLKLLVWIFRLGMISLFVALAPMAYQTLMFVLQQVMG